MPSPLKLAIVGAGIASLSLAKSLAKNPNLQITIFEASTDNSWTSGQAIGLAKNAKIALRLIDDDLEDVVEKAGGVPMSPALRLKIGSGEHSGELIGDFGEEMGVSVVARGAMMRELSRNLDGGVKILHGKKVEKITFSPSGEVELHFPPPTPPEEFDAIIGSDGLNSTIRSSLHPDLGPISTGGWNHRIVVPLSEARKVFGEEYCSQITQTGYIGDGGFCLTDFCDEGESMQIIAGWMGDREKEGRWWPYEEGFHEWPKEKLEKDLEGWGTVGEALTKLFTSQPKLYAATGRIHPPTPSFSSKNICLIGDAAQSFPPFKGAGAGLAIEDALCLGSLLQAISTREEIKKAFGVYDQLRRPRRQAIADASREAGRVFCGRSEAGLDGERMRRWCEGWGEDVVGFDVEGMVREGRGLMEEGS